MNLCSINLLWIIFTRAYVFIFRQRLVITLNCRISSQIFIWSENIHIMVLWRNCRSCKSLIVLCNKSDLCSLGLPISFSFNFNICDHLNILFSSLSIVWVWLFLKMTVSHIVIRPSIVSIRIFLTFVCKIWLHSINRTFIITLVTHMVINIVFNYFLVWKLVIIRGRKKSIFKF